MVNLAEISLSAGYPGNNSYDDKRKVDDRHSKGDFFEVERCAYVNCLVLPSVTYPERGHLSGR